MRVGVAAGEVSQGRWFGEPHVGAMADGEVAESLRDMAFPTPTGLSRMTDCPACSQRRAARWRIAAASSVGLAVKSNSSSVV